MVSIPDRIVAFDALLDEAFRDKYGDQGDGFGEMHSAWSLSTFCHSFVDGVNGGLHPYPLHRMERALDYAMDLKLQRWLLIEVDAGVYNSVYHDLVNAFPAAEGSARVRLIRLSLDQTIVVKTRIVWERMMALIVWLENGREPSGSSSWRRKFLELVNENEGRWVFASRYVQVLERWDNGLRTGEVHGMSPLRRLLLSDQTMSLTDWTLSLSIVDDVWRNLVGLLRGETPRQGFDAHRDGRSLIDGGDPLFDG